VEIKRIDTYVVLYCWLYGVYYWQRMEFTFGILC